MPYSFSISPISLVLMITMPSACSAHMLLWFTLPPILGGWLADRLLGNRTAVIAGALLMTLGHVVLGIDTNSTFSLYLALAIIICGYGLFKSNISCLLGELYDENDHRRDGGFSLLYAAGNIGSIAAPIACGLAAQWYGWHVGFALAGGGMFIGLLIFLSGHRHFQSTRSMDKKALTSVKFALPVWSWLVVMLCLAPVFFTLLLENDWSGYLLAIVCLIAAQIIARMMIKFPEHRRALWQIVLLMFVGTLFWVLAQQGGSTISLFIDRFVNRQAFNIEVPTALFQSVNAIAVMLAGVVLALAGVARKPRQFSIARLAEVCLWLTADGLWLYVAGI
ncbi:oligopeptide:H+ symporter [Escherichia coli]|nr:oligopeptide:H+ symporter [Escherichia coli]